MPTNLKYAPGTTRACKSCGQPFLVPANRQITGDFCSPHCGIWWSLSRSPKWAKRRDTTRPTAAALLHGDAARAFAEVLLNPPAPNAALRAALLKANLMSLSADLTSLSGGQDLPSLVASLDMLSEGAPTEAPPSHSPRSTATEAEECAPSL